MIWGLRHVRTIRFCPKARAGPRRGLQPRQQLLATGNLAATVTFTIFRPPVAALDDPDAATPALLPGFRSRRRTTLGGGTAGRPDHAVGYRRPSRKRSHTAGHDEFVASMAHGTRRQDARLLWRRPRGTDLGLAERPRALFDPEPDPTFAALSISPDGRLLALGDQVNPVVRIWDLTTGAGMRFAQGLPAPSLRWRSAPAARPWPRPT